MPRAPLVVVNPIAGSGRAHRFARTAAAWIDGAPDARLVVTQRAGDAERLAADAIGTHDRIVVAGGDGTVQEVVNGIGAAESGPSLGIVPVGRGNDLARSLGIPRDAARAWAWATGETVRSVDLARARGGDGRTRWFASAGGIGFDAQVASAMASRRGWQGGRAGYLLTTLVELRRFGNRRVRITIDGVAHERTVLFVAIANGEYYGGGMRIAPGATVDDAMLDVCIVGDVSRATALRQLANLYRGTHVNHPAVELVRGRELKVEGDADTRAHLDGEPFGTLPISVDLRPGALRVAVDAASVG